METNHNRPIEDFITEINLIKEKGYNPIAVTQIFFEDAYVFETHEEAMKAYKEFELDRKTQDDIIVGFWYGKEEFLKEVNDYEKKLETKVLIHWLT